MYLRRSQLENAILRKELKKEWYYRLTNSHNYVKKNLLLNIHSILKRISKSISNMRSAMLWENIICTKFLILLKSFDITKISQNATAIKNWFFSKMVSYSQHTPYCIPWCGIKEIWQTQWWSGVGTGEYKRNNRGANDIGGYLMRNHP